jgi:hypothetical protein
LNGRDQETLVANNDILVSAMPKVAATKQGRPRQYATPRKATTLRLSDADHEYIQLMKFLRGMSLAQVVGAALAEYRERHRAEVAEIQKQKEKFKQRNHVR